MEEEIRVAQSRTSVQKVARSHVASSHRLDLNIILGFEKLGHIKTFLSGHLPILIRLLALVWTDGRHWQRHLAYARSA